MAILITQARFTQEGSKGTTATSENRVKAASQLVAKAGGTLIAYYLTSGDYDVLLIFQMRDLRCGVRAAATIVESSACLLYTSPSPRDS